MSLQEITARMIAYNGTHYIRCTVVADMLRDLATAMEEGGPVIDSNTAAGNLRLIARQLEATGR